MAAIGGETIVPTNWSGLLITLVLIAALAVGTYFAIDFQFGNSEAVEESTGKTSLQDVFSPAAKPKYRSVDTARASARAGVRRTAPVTPAPASRVAADVDENGSDDDEAVAEAPPVPTPIRPAAAAKPVVKPVAKAPATSSTQASQSTSSTTVPAALPAGGALKAWWAEPPLPAGSLIIRYVGAMDRGDSPSNAVAVMFGEAVSPASLAGLVEVRDSNNELVAGSWQTGRNPALLFFEGLNPGRYEVSLSAGIRSGNGKELKRAVRGPVSIY